MLPIQWHTSNVPSDTEVFWDTVSHASGTVADYTSSSSDATMVNSHSVTPGMTDSSPQNNYYNLSSSADGTKLVRVRDWSSDISASNDSGATWHSISFGSYDRGLAIDSTGLKIFIGTWGADIWNATSSDNGATYNWTNLSSNSTNYPGGSYWSSIASNASGTKIAAVNAYGGIYTATTSDNGATWTWHDQTGGAGSRSWIKIISDSTGTKLVAITSNGIWRGVSTDDGGSYTWTDLSSISTNFPSDYLQSLTTSADGSMIAVGGNSDIYIATTSDNGASWSWIDQNENGSGGWNHFWSIASNASGTEVIAAPQDGPLQIANYSIASSSWVWTSPAFHSSWEWWIVASDASGSNLSLTGRGGLWTSSDSGVTWTGHIGTTYYYRVKSCNGAACTTSAEHTLVYSISSSCPFIFTWDGHKYNFIIDASSASTLGSGTNLSQWKKTPFYAPTIYPNPESFVKIPNGELVARNDGSGPYYDIKTTFELNEVNYFDQAALEVVDHSPSVDVFPDYRNNGQIHTIAKNAPAPVSVRDQTGADVSSLIAHNDNVFWHSIVGTNPSYLDMKLSDASTTPTNLKIVIRKGAEGMFRGNRQFDVLQYKNADGHFVNVPADMNPFLVTRLGASTSTPAFENTYGANDTQVIDLSGLTIKDNDIRLIVTNTNLQTDIDWIAVDTNPDDAITTTEVAPSYADLHFRGVSKLVRSNPLDPQMLSMTEPDYSQLSNTVGEGNIISGYATRYGDVLPLVTSADDKFVIATQGDELALKYSVPIQATGTVRDFINKTFDYHKSYHNGTGDTIAQLPFAAMTQYPYHENVEHYPTDADHNAYQATYNTRQVDWGLFESILNFIHHSLNTDFIGISISEGGAPVVHVPQTTVSLSSSGGSVSNAALATILTPGPATDAYLRSRGLTVPTVSIAASTTVVTPTTTTTPAKFTRDLQVSSNGSDVKALQQYLNTHGYTIATRGVGSPGHETTLFGLLTKKALMKFQKTNHLPVTGFFGPKTRAVVNVAI